MHELVYNPRIVGGIDADSTKVVAEFYKNFAKKVKYLKQILEQQKCVSLLKIALEIQILLLQMNFLLLHENEVNVWELIKFANMHPRVNILNPGCGEAMLYSN